MQSKIILISKGWSLELLLTKNTQWQAICNGMGIGIGGFIGNALFLTFESEDFSNNYIRPLFGIEKKSGGLITLKCKSALFRKMAIFVPSIKVDFFLSSSVHVYDGAHFSLHVDFDLHFQEREESEEACDRIGTRANGEALRTHSDKHG